MCLYHVAFVLIVAVAVHAVIYAGRTWRLANRRGAVGLVMLAATAVALGWWVLFGRH
jgi:hypothetical protein